MSTSKHIGKICAVVVAIMLVLTVVFMNGASLGISSAVPTMGYESRIFDTSKVHTIDIVMDDWDSFIENCESEEYSNCTAVIDGESFKNIAIRAKGNTSLSSVKSLGSQRYSLKLEFDHYESGKTYHGLDKLCLNNLIQDNTMMKDYLVYQMMNEFGVESPLCSFSYITVNGEDWGLYLAVEGIEDSFMKRTYDSDSGEMYKPDSMGFGGGRGNGKGFNMDDFNNQNQEQNTEQNKEQFTPKTSKEQTDIDAQTGATQKEFSNRPSFSTEGDTDTTRSFPNGMPGNIPNDILNNKFGGIGGGMGSDDVKLKYIDDNPESYSNIFDNAKTDVSTADKDRLIASLKDLSAYENIESIVNIDEVTRYFVVHNFVCNGDSYTGSMVHNYYLHENDGMLSMIPWDYNLGFGTFQGNQASNTVNTSIDSPVSNGNVDDRPMVGWIFSNDEYTEKYYQLFTEFISDYFESGKVQEIIENTTNLIRPYVEKDPTKFCTTEEFEKGVKALASFVSFRATAVKNQLNGDDTPVDVGELNLSDMGTMNNGKGGFGNRNGKEDSQNTDNFQMPPMNGNMPELSNDEE